MGEELDRRRSATVTQNGEPGGKSGWQGISVQDLLQFLERCNKKYALPQYQKRFADLQEKHGQDKTKYLSAIEPILIEVEGPVMVAFELIEDQALGTVQASRKEMAACLQRHRNVKEVCEC